MTQLKTGAWESVFGFGQAGVLGESEAQGESEVLGQVEGCLL